MKRKMIHCQ